MFEWYRDAIVVLQHHKNPHQLMKSKSRFVKFYSLRYCIVNKNLYWRDTYGILLNCLLEYEVEKVIHEFHKGDCGGHRYWKATRNKIPRVRYYCPCMFKDIYKTIVSCNEYQIFYGKKKLMPLPLKPICIEAPFQ